MDFFPSNTEEINFNFENKISSQINETISFLNNHLNLGQNLTINTSEVLMLFSKTSVNLRENKQIQLIENATIYFPLNFCSSLNCNENI